MADTHLSDQPGTVQAAMNVGDRVVVKSGPWPERIGSHGAVVDGIEIFPFRGVSDHECVVLLDEDPLDGEVRRADPRGLAYHPHWTCVMARRDLAAELW